MINKNDSFDNEELNGESISFHSFVAQCQTEYLKKNNNSLYAFSDEFMKKMMNEYLLLSQYFKREVD